MEKLGMIFSHTDDSQVDHELSVNLKTGELYWDKRKIITEKKLTLAWWVNGAIILGALSTFALALSDWLMIIGF